MSRHSYDYIITYKFFTAWPSGYIPNNNNLFQGIIFEDIRLVKCPLVQEKVSSEMISVTVYNHFILLSYKKLGFVQLFAKEPSTRFKWFFVTYIDRCHVSQNCVSIIMRLRVTRVYKNVMDFIIQN